MSLWPALVEATERYPENSLLTGTLSADLTRTEVLERARRLIGALGRLGIAPGDRVAVVAPPSDDVVALEWALSGLGAIQAPLNTGLQGILLSGLLGEIEPKLIAVSPELAATVRDALSSASVSVPLLVIGDEEPMAPDAPMSWAEALGWRAEEGQSGAPHEATAIIFTSGTTGPSKGVVLSNRWVLEYCRRVNDLMEITPEDRHYGFLPLFHIAGQYAHVVSAALAGASVALCEPFRAERFWPEVERYRCTQVILMSSMVSVVRDGAPARTSLKRLHMVPLPPDFAEIGKRLDCRVSTNYGSTEASIPITNPHPTDYKSCGKLLEGYDARIVDEWDNELPDGTVGELILRPSATWTAMTEYWGRPEATSRAWRNGWLHTGDLFLKRPDGGFVFVDRAKDAIRRRGENISTYELEMLACMHPDVFEAAAVGIDLGDGEQEVAVFYALEPEEEAALEPEAFYAHLATTAPRHMLPRYVRRMAALPRTHTGKVLKSDLQDTPISSMWDRREAAREV